MASAALGYATTPADTPTVLTHEVQEEQLEMIMGTSPQIDNDNNNEIIEAMADESEGSTNNVSAFTQISYVSFDSNVYICPHVCFLSFQTIYLI